LLFTERVPKEVVDEGLLTQAPVRISNFVYSKIIARNENEKRHAHHYAKETLEQIQEALDEPLAIIRSPGEDGSMVVAILTKTPDYQGDPSLVIIGVDKESEDNYVKSIYGKRHVAEYLQRQLSKGNLAYLAPDIKEALNALDKVNHEMLEEVIRGYKQQNQLKAMQTKTSLSAIKSIITQKKQGFS